MKEKRCPNCKSLNPANAMRCDCGYNFSDKEVDASYSNNPSKKKLKAYEHLICGWPLVLVFMGGAIGGACGGLAYGINAKILNTNLSNAKKYTYATFIGIGAVALYFIIVLILAILFPGMFTK